MLVQDVVKSLIHSYNTTSMDSTPSIINLLGINKKQKREIILQTYNQFIKNGSQAIVLVSLSCSSSLFHYVLTHTPKIMYWKNRVYTEKNKRYDLIVLYFCNKSDIDGLANYKN